MAFRLRLSRRLARQWQVKIRDREREEPPHVTILRRTQAWRVDLRTGKFLDRVPHPSEVPRTLMEEIQRRWSELQQRWDELYPENPVGSSEDTSD